MTQSVSEWVTDYGRLWLDLGLIKINNEVFNSVLSCFVSHSFSFLLCTLDCEQVRIESSSLCGSFIAIKVLAWLATFQSCSEFFILKMIGTNFPYFPVHIYMAQCLACIFVNCGDENYKKLVCGIETVFFKLWSISGLW